MISCEIRNAGKYDLIIPLGWWHDEHLLMNIVNPTMGVFNDRKCRLM